MGRQTSKCHCLKSKRGGGGIMLAASQLVHASSFILLIAGKICFDCEAKKNQHFVLFNRVPVVIF